MPPRDSSPKLGHPDVAGWVLSALDPDDAEHFAEHLLSCDACQAAVIELESVARALRNPIAEPSTAAMQPPADLAARTLTRVEWAARLVGAETTRTGPEIQVSTSTSASASASASEADPDIPQPTPETMHTDPATKAADAKTQRSGQVVRVAAWRRASVRAISLGTAAAVAIGAGIAVWASQPGPTALAFTIPLRAAHGGTATGQAYARHRHMPEAMESARQAGFGDPLPGL